MINQEAKGRKIEKWVHLNQCKRFVPDPCQRAAITPAISNAVDSHIDPSSEAGDSQGLSSENEEYEPDTADGSELSYTEPMSAPLRRSERLRTSSRKFLEAQWSDELLDDSENQD